VNQSVDAFANLLIRSAGFNDLGAFPPGSLIGDTALETEMGIILLHVKIEEEV
jgi:hypothetical protein